MTQPTRDRRLSWLIAGGAGMLVLLFVSQLYVWVNWWPTRIGWGTAFFWAIPQLLVWGLFVPAIARLSNRFPIEEPVAARRAVLHAVASVAAAFLGLAVLDVSDRILHWTRLLGAGVLISQIKYTIIHLHMGIAIYWVVVVVDHAFRYYGRSREHERLASELEARLAQAQLQALRLQLHPHFLFNTLNSIAVLMRRDVASAEGLLHRLGDLLRVSLDAHPTAEITVAEELEYLRNYLEIEAARFQDRLSLHFDVDPLSLHGHVPNLLLQPLVENAIRHGVASQPGGGRVTIGTRRIGRTLELVVRDDGPGLPEDWERQRKDGIGLSNTRRRLRALFGDDQHLELRPVPTGGLEVVVRIPFSTGETRSSDESEREA